MAGLSLAILTFLHRRLEMRQVFAMAVFGQPRSGTSQRECTYFCFGRRWVPRSGDRIPSRIPFRGLDFSRIHDVGMLELREPLGEQKPSEGFALPIG